MSNQVRLSELAQADAEVRRPTSGIYGNRKFIVSLVALIGNQLLAAFDRIDPGVYSVVAVAVIGAYIAGNVIQHNQGARPQ